MLTGTTYGPSTSTPSISISITEERPKLRGGFTVVMCAKTRLPFGATSMSPIIICSFSARMIMSPTLTFLTVSVSRSIPLTMVSFGSSNCVAMMPSGSSFISRRSRRETSGPGWLAPSSIASMASMRLVSGQVGCISWLTPHSATESLKRTDGCVSVPLSRKSISAVWRSVRLPGSSRPKMVLSTSLSLLRRPPSRLLP